MYRDAMHRTMIRAMFEGSEVDVSQDEWSDDRTMYRVSMYLRMIGAIIGRSSEVGVLHDDWCDDRTMYRKCDTSAMIGAVIGRCIGFRCIAR